MLNVYRIGHKYQVLIGHTYVRGNMGYSELSCLALWLEYQFTDIYEGSIAIGPLEMHLVLHQFYGFDVVTAERWRNTAKRLQEEIDLYWNWESRYVRARLRAIDTARFAREGLTTFLKNLPHLARPIYDAYIDDLERYARDNEEAEFASLGAVN